MNGQHLDETYVVVPAYNEQDVIGGVVAELRAVCRNIIVVDDGSTDHSGQRARTAGAIVLRHAINRGQGAALQTGFAFALAKDARYIVTFDADGQHCAADLDGLIKPLVDGRADIVLGSRFLGHAVAIPRHRRLLLKAAVWFTRIASGVKVTDTHNGLRAFSRRAAEKIDISLDRMAHASQLLDQIRKSGLPYEEQPVTVRYTNYSREKGQSSAGAFTVLWEYLFDRLTR